MLVLKTILVKKYLHWDDPTTIDLGLVKAIFKYLLTKGAIW